MKNSVFSAGQDLLKEVGRLWAPLRDQLARRAALAREPAPRGVATPPLKFLVSEIQSLARPARAHRGVEPARYPRPVMLIPGFGSHPKRMRPMYDALETAGHHVEDWGLGFNLGPTPENFAFLMRRVANVERAYGAKVALVGWSLGGLFAREIARRQPDRVDRVITMGTPFSVDPRANNGWRAYQVLTGHSVDAPPIEYEFAAKPPVPTVALWSARDGIVHPRSAAGWPGERDEAVALRCTHMDFAASPEAIAEVLRQLDRAD